MKTSKKIIITALILFTLDFLLTSYFINHSNYADEGNPLINNYYGYTIIVINLLYFIIVVVITKIIEKYKTVSLQSKGTFDYMKKLYQSDHYRFIFISLGFAFIYASLVSRSIVVVDWLVFGIYGNKSYSTIYFRIRNLMPFSRYDIIFGALSFFIFIIIWYRLEYKKSKKELSKNKLFI